MGGLDLIKSKLADYTRAYYFHQALRGVVLWLAVFVTGFLVIATAEYFFRFSSQARTVLFWTYFGLFLAWLIVFVLVPLLRMQRWITRISEEEAAKKIGGHQAGLDDKLLNSLGLSKIGLSDNALIQAAIDQKAKEIEHLDFKAYVDWSQLKKLLPYSLAPVLIILGITLSEEGREVLEGGRRVVYYNQDFRPPAPFDFILDQNYYQLESGQSLSIRLRIEGEQIPERVTAQSKGMSFAMVKEGKAEWVLRLEDIEASRSLFFEALGYQSEEVQIDVLKSPSLGAVELRVVPPTYTGLKPFEESLRPSVEVPLGSQLYLRALGQKNIDKLILKSQDSSLEFKDGRLEWTALKNLDYDLEAEGEELNKTLLKGGAIQILPDQRPSIVASYKQDSSSSQDYYVSLSLSDDYGLSRLERVLNIGEREYRESLALNSLMERLNFDSLAHQGGDLDLYYQVWDNDRINGPKSSRSQSLRIKLLSQEEQEEALSKQMSNMRSSASQQKEKRKEYQRSLEKLERAFNQKKNLDWQKKQEIKDLLLRMEEENKALSEERKKLEKNLEKLNAPEEEKQQVKDRLKEMSEAEKELEKLKEEIQKLLEELNPQEMQQKLEQLQQENQQQLRREERMDELLKDLLFQRDLLKESQRLKDLSEQLKNLAKQDDDGAKEQAELEKELQESLEKLEEMSKDNAQLKQEMDSETFQKAQEQAEESMSEAKENMEQGKEGEANENQEEASEATEEMSESLQSLMSSMQQQALEINMESLRRILENLKRYSLDVEESGLRIQSLGRQDPRYRDLLKEQSRLMAGSKVIEDSLVVLSEKAPQVKEDIFKELIAMQNSLVKAQKELQEQVIDKASTEHQYSMMAANNLALMLDESLQNMMSMMAQKKQGQQNCEKPGQGKPKPGQMSKKMSEMGKKVERLQKGTKDGKGKEGKGKEMAQILAEQEALRQMFEQMDEGEMGSKGNKEGLLEELDKMEDALLEEDYQQFVERFKRIETRLLESEKALEERKQKEEREAETGEIKRMRSGEELLEKNRKAQEQLDRYMRRSLKLKGIYYELSKG